MATIIDPSPINPTLYRINPTYARIHDVLVRWEERDGVTSDRPFWVWELFHDLDRRCMDMEADCTVD